MIETLKELFIYFKNPILEEDQNIDFSYRIKKFISLLLICLATGFLISPLFILIESLGFVDMQNHAMEDLMKKLSKPIIFLFAAIIAPVFEELIFRAPLTAFKKKNQFRIAFYVFTILFGLVHITNFDITTNVLLLSPILVLPQLLVGGYFGFIRIRFGLVWSMALHGCYNAILMLVSFSTY
ncbi:CPBP family intramembrane glutamic endopeptidase [Polaribacter sp. MED152]|uniref:CPBP family intramembrane glutamic endopeptidase n=1 Tax=Polaribacter sp. MED152 TaxID=313598 RepID=UPI000068CB46|nr:CPBP family intramembrane glutamic endopeptidase [Polaribacter sp. MED152]EAQ41743.1 CAAX amino terminal protease family [Polaribacter sp. MED152]